MTALKYATIKGHSEVVQELLSCGALSHNNLGENWPLTFATLHGHNRIVQLLLGKKSDPVTVGDALAALRRTLHKPEPNYEISALLQMHVVRQAQAQQHASDVADVNGANLFAGIRGVVEAPALVGVLDRGALSMALLRGWRDNTPGASEGQDAVAAMERGSAVMRANAREALVQLAGAVKEGS